MGGKGSKLPKVKPGPFEQAQADIARRQDTRAQQLETEYLDPLRMQQMPMIQQALATNPYSTKLEWAERQPIEGQYNQVRNALLNTGVRGGQLRSQMAGLERDRANAISGAANMAK